MGTGVDKYGERCAQSKKHSCSHFVGFVHVYALSVCLQCSTHFFGISFLTYETCSKSCNLGYNRLREQKHLCNYSEIDNRKRLE